MIYSLIDFFGISVSIEQALRTVMGHIIALIYSLIEYLYTVFEYVSKAQILENEFIQSIYYKVGMILGIFMIFKLVFSLIQSLVDPNKFTDKKNGFSSIIVRCIVSIVLLGFTPAIFKEAFKLQNTIVGGASSDNIIYKIIVGSSSTGKLSNMGRVMASDLYFTFFTDNEEPKLDHGSTDIFESSASELDKEFYDRFKNDDYASLKSDVTSKNKSFQDTVSYLAIKQSLTDDYVIEFNWLLLLAVGIFMIWILAMYCIQTAVRVVQLAYLQLIAPVPIISYINDPEGSFKKWVNQCLSTYLDLFIRLAIIYFVVAMVGDVMEQFTKMGGSIIESTGLAGADWFTIMLVKVFIIIGLLLFAKKVPELLKDLFPNLGISSGKFSFGLNPKKEVAEPIKNIFKDTPIGWIPKGAGNLAKGAIGFVDRKIHNAPKPRGKFGQYMDKLMPERAKVVEANRQAKLDEKLRKKRDDRGEEIYNKAWKMENGERKFDPEKAFVGNGSKKYIDSFNEVKKAKKAKKEAEDLVADLDKELTAAYAMPARTDKEKRERAEAIILAKAKKDAAVKNYGAQEARYNLAKEAHDSMKKQSQYSKFAKIEDDYKYYDDRHPNFVTPPKDMSEVSPEHKKEYDELINNSPSDYGSQISGSSNNNSEPEIIIPNPVREEPKEPSRFEDEERTRRHKETQAEIEKETAKINEKINDKKDNIDDLLKQRIDYLQKTLADLISYKETVRDNKDIQELEKEIAKVKEELDKLFK